MYVNSYIHTYIYIYLYLCKYRYGGGGVGCNEAFRVPREEEVNPKPYTLNPLNPKP